MRHPDLLIVGGGTSGVAAALTALRLGLRVVLTEETDWLGGQLTAQAVPPDENAWIETADAPPGYAEFRNRVRDYYRRLGFQIALDDTGAGYASLEAVMELSPDFIKVDRAFVHGIDQDPARQELLRALRSVADRIGARIIGEGLDTLEELSTLGGLGIPFGQGWLFGKPHPLRSDL